VRLKTLLTADAQLDIQQAAFWYKKQSSGLGIEFVKSVRQAIKSIRNTPFGFTTRVGNLRAIPLNRFPYLLYYQIDEKDCLIIVFAILHSHRNPAYTQKRLPD
jgi:plasmid stabilization system protein ParE